MGLRFRKSIKLAPGVRLNFSARGASATLGPRGASVNLGGRGAYLNTGIPGTGLYARERIGGSKAAGVKMRKHKASSASMSVSVQVADDGTVSFYDSDGNPLSERLIVTAKKQKGDLIRRLIETKCDEINSQFEALGRMHFDTPGPRNKPRYQARIFEEEQPPLPDLRGLGLLGRLFASRRAKIDRLNVELQREYEHELNAWRVRQKEFDESERRKREIIEHGIYNDINAMETFLESRLQEIEWPRETIVSAEVQLDGECVFADVDLPEIEDMPTKTASVPKRGYKLSVKDMSSSQIQKLYMHHVHGVGFRIVGEIFSALPNSRIVMLSAFSQRIDPATGHITDQYLYSVRVRREEWSEISFKNLQVLEVVEALARFDLRRNMTKTGVFKEIVPFEPKDIIIN